MKKFQFQILVMSGYTCIYNIWQEEGIKLIIQLQLPLYYNYQRQKPFKNSKGKNPSCLILL